MSKTNDANKGDSTDGSGALAEFFAFIADFQSVIALMAKMAIAAPMLDFVFKVGPPWPSRAATAFFVVVLQILILIYAFEFWRHRSTALKGVRNSLKYFLFATPVALVVYIVVFSIWIGQLDPDDAASRYVAGFNYTEAAQILREHSDAMIDPAAAAEASDVLPAIKLSDRHLLTALHKEDEVWTAGSLIVTRLIVLLSWILLWSLISVVIASFMAIQWKRKKK